MYDFEDIINNIPCIMLAMVCNPLCLNILSISESIDTCLNDDEFETIYATEFDWESGSVSAIPPCAFEYLSVIPIDTQVYRNHFLVLLCQLPPIKVAPMAVWNTLLWLDSLIIDTFQFTLHPVSHTPGDF